jgi:SRSO17 transposase
MSSARAPLRRVTWRNGTKGPLSARFAWRRVWPAYGWAQGQCAGAEPHWLLIEQRKDGSLRYAFSNLPARTSRLAALRYWHSRWPVEQGYQQMKEELGLDHFEGRSWQGFHRHAVLVMLAYGFLTLERLRLQQQRPEGPATAIPALKKKRRCGESDESGGPRLTLPAVRRALQRLLLPTCPLECPYCRALAHL